MTGATRDLGRVAAVEILRRDPQVHLAVLARSTGDAAAQALAIESGNPHVSAYSADLSSASSIRAAVDTVTTELDAGRLPRLAGFIGNAGQQLLSTSGSTAEGIEATFGVNVFANYLVIAGLREHFVVPARIVITASDTHFGDFAHNMGMVPAPEWRTVPELMAPGTGPTSETASAGRTAYSTSKLAVIYLVHSLARTLPAGIEIVSFNPGFVPGTGLARDGGPVTRFLFRAVMPLLTITPWARSQNVSGADLASVALGETAITTGDYVNGQLSESSSVESYNSVREDELLAELERLASVRPIHPGGALGR